MPLRIGVGFDAHRFTEGRPLVLGTIAVEHDRGLAGHSDGDVLAHAIVDAVLGAAGLGDIGAHFPSSDPRWEGADSALFLGHAAAAASKAGYRIASVDATVICERPRIDRYRHTIASTLAEVLGGAAVGVKGTTTDGLGFTGREEGIAAIAVALLETP